MIVLFLVVVEWWIGAGASIFRISKITALGRICRWRWVDGVRLFSGLVLDHEGAVGVKMMELELHLLLSRYAILARFIDRVLLYYMV